ncbi:hypothetical protein QBC37DRAFT_486482 [Rhypophila decipiens]|uniref:Uncharacterized protein n=1 Tax=Rhypophila decipiens TaxID=261697 RepID=A0AAN7B5H6_9PEZI|nr:hypothetical protein QBC37DRAFT_486482 [Rhypophila decipiens]
MRQPTSFMAVLLASGLISTGFAAPAHRNQARQDTGTLIPSESASPPEATAADPVESTVPDVTPVPSVSFSEGPQPTEPSVSFSQALPSETVIPTEPSVSFSEVFPSEIIPPIETSISDIIPPVSTSEPVASFSTTAAGPVEPISSFSATAIEPVSTLSTEEFVKRQPAPEITEEDAQAEFDSVPSFQGDVKRTRQQEEDQSDENVPPTNEDAPGSSGGEDGVPPENDDTPDHETEPDVPDEETDDDATDGAPVPDDTNDADNSDETPEAPPARMRLLRARTAGAVHMPRQFTNETEPVIPPVTNDTVIF